MHCAKALERDLLGLFLCNKQPTVKETKEKLIEKMSRVNQSNVKVWYRKT
ncbi:hypothetical protein ACNSTQ_21805 [Alkalihalobacterium sp. APHAB7]